MIGIENLKEIEKQLKELQTQLETFRKTVDNRVELGKLLPGDKFMLCGKEFIVLHVYKDGTADVICNELWFEDVKFGATNNYAESEAAKLCNTIQEIIEEEIGADNLITQYVDLTALDGGKDYGLHQCKVAPITFGQARNYFPLLVNEELDDWWWMATPWNSKGIGYSNAVTVVSPSGYFSCNDCLNCNGVRPFCILKSNIFVSTQIGESEK